MRRSTTNLCHSAQTMSARAATHFQHSDLRCPLVVLQQTTESVANHNATCPKHWRSGESFIAHSLVRPFRGVVLYELPHQVIQVPLAEHHELVQALLLNRLDEPFDVGVEVR